MQQMTDGKQSTQHCKSALSLRRHLQYIMGKTMDFSQSKNKTKRIAIQEQIEELCT